MQKRNNIVNLLDYLRGKLTNKERRSLEKEMNDDPFLSDAMDGFAKQSADLIESDLAELHNKLEQKVSESKSRSILPFVRIAASIVLLIGIATTIYLLTNPDLPIENIAEHQYEEKQSEAVDKPVTAPLKHVQAIEQIEPETENSPKSSKPVSETREKRITGDSEKQKEESEKIPISTPIAYEDNQRTKSAEAHAPEQIKADIAEKSTSQTGLLELRSEESIEEGLVTISGKAIDMETFEPLPGVSITAQGTRYGTITDMDGNFSLETVPDAIIIISYVGYLTEEISVDKLLEQDEPLALKQDIAQMDEVVVVGYGAQKKRAKSVTNPLLESEEEETAIVDTIAPEPKTGFDAYYDYVQKNKQIDLNNSMSITLSITIDAKGKIVKIKVQDPKIGDLYKEEAIRLIKEGPKWNPGQESGVPVKQKIIITIEL